jgi:hypothetical protein
MSSNAWSGHDPQHRNPVCLRSKPEGLLSHDSGHKVSDRRVYKCLIIDAPYGVRTGVTALRVPARDTRKHAI